MCEGGNFCLKAKLGCVRKIQTGKLDLANPIEHMC